MLVGEMIIENFTSFAREGTGKHKTRRAENQNVSYKVMKKWGWLAKFYFSLFSSVMLCRRIIKLLLRSYSSLQIPEDSNLEEVQYRRVYQKIVVPLAIEDYSTQSLTSFINYLLHNFSTILLKYLVKRIVYCFIDFEAFCCVFVFVALWIM